MIWLWPVEQQWKFPAVFARVWKQPGLDLLALLRALDRMDLTPAEIPQRLIRQLFKLDADYAEALWALDQRHGTLDMRVMLRDALAALDQLSEACAKFRTSLPPRDLPALTELERSSVKAWTRRKHITWSPATNPQNC